MVNVLTYGDPVSVIEGFFALTLVFNTGAAFGMFQSSQKLFLILPVLTVILVLILFVKSKDKQNMVLPLALLLGGTIGNFIDRVRWGYVIDFFDFYWGSFHWPAFNFADAGICMGILLLVWQIAIKPVNNS